MTATASSVPFSLRPLSIPSPLSNILSHQRPRYSQSVLSAQGSEVLLGDPRITRITLAIMNQYAVDGGAACHWGGPSAFAEIMSALHGYMFTHTPAGKNWYDCFHFVNDAGHTENGVYALRANLGFGGMDFPELWDFRSIKSKYTGHAEAHLNPEGVLISNGPLGSGLPQAQGLALADHLSQNERITICTISDGGLMEGEARESLAAIAGLAQKNKINPFLLVLSDNNTKLSGRIDQDSYSMQPTFASLEAMGWQVLEVPEGHNLQKVYSSIEQGIQWCQQRRQRPVCLIIKTIKGYGVQATEKSSSGGHGYPLKKGDEKFMSFLQEIMGPGTPVPAEFLRWAEGTKLKKENPTISPSLPLFLKNYPVEKVQVGISSGAIQAFGEGLPVVSLSADLAGSTGMAEFQKKYPQATIDLGVAEANMVSSAIGLSKCGYIPIVDTFAQFGITKGNLPLIMSSLSQGPILAVFSHTGFQDAADGASHQATTYFAAVSGIPHLQVVSLSCSSEANAYLYQAIKYQQQERQNNRIPDSIIFFCGRENFHRQYEEQQPSYRWGKAQVLVPPSERSQLLLVATGPMVVEALWAREILLQQGIDICVVNSAFINRPDVETLGPLLQRCQGRLLTVEDHQVVGGMGSQLIHALHLSQAFSSSSSPSSPNKMFSLGIPGTFGQSAYMASHLYEKYGLSGAQIAETARNFLAGKIVNRF